MAQRAEFEEPQGNPTLRWALIALAVAAFLAFVWYLYTGLNGVHAVKVEDDAPVTISPMLPPPPPPPPPKPQDKPPEPVDKPTPAPTPAPSPKPDAPAPMQMNAEAQAGASGIASGTGGGAGGPGGNGNCLTPPCGTGPVGGAVSDGFYGRYLSSLLQQRVQRDGKVNRSVFSADFAIYISGGRVTRADLVRSSGDERRDALLKSIIEGTGGLNAPPTSFKMPQRITVRGRRSI